MVEDVDPVVLPRAVQFPVSAVCAAVVAPEIMSVLPENPTDAPPAPLMVRSCDTDAVVEDVLPVVLPKAVQLPVSAVCAAPPVAPAMMRVLPEKPTLTPPEPDIVSNSDTDAEVDDVDPVVLPSAVQLPVSAVWAAVVAPEMIMFEPLKPTDTPPAPEKVSWDRVVLCDDVVPVVLPTATWLPVTAPEAEVVAPEMTIVEPERPTLTPPAPENVKLESVATDEVVRPVVLPSATMSAVWIVCAAVVAPAMTMDEPLNPTETPPAPENVNWDRLVFCEEVEPVVLPTATWLPVPAAPVAPETISVLPEKPTDTPPAPLIVRSCETAAVVDDVEPVVFPRAVQFPVSAVWAAVVAPLITIVAPVKPTEAPPAPENVKALRELLVLVVEAVVLPIAK